MMRDLVRIMIGIVIAVNLSIIGSLGLTVNCQADDAETEMVPEPWVNETHEYDVTGEVDGTPTDEYFVNEAWSIEVRHGDVMTLIMARNITQGDVTSVDYQNNIHYSIGGKLYIAQFMIMELVFIIGGYEIHAPLGTCSDFEVQHSPTTYDGTVPTLYCNFTFEGVHIYNDGSLPAEYSLSTVDLTLIHHIRGDWNNTHMKVEALLNFENTRFFDPNDNNEEFETGEQFTARVGYMMMLANPEDFRTIGPVIPSSYTNTTLVYNMTLDNGSPLTMSKLEMRDDFSIFNASGASSAVGYSSMEVFGGQAHVTHGFPNLTYNDTQSMRSDPEVTIFHDMVTEAYSPASDYLWVLIPVVAGIAVAIMAIFILKRRTSGGSRDP